MVKNFTPINKRLCIIRLKDRFFNYSLINIHAPTNDSEEEAKDQFYEQLERANAACPSHDVNLVKGDANAKVGRETVHQSTISKQSLHESTNENGFRLVAGRLCRRQANGDQKYVLHAQTSLPPNLALPRWTYLQPDRTMLDSRKTLF
jgi:hypothetical protein